MPRFSVLVSSLLACALCLIGPGPSAAATTTNVIKIATLAPRDSSFMRAFDKIDKRMREISGGEVQFRLYPSGTAGDEKDMLRKMRAGQLDAAMVTSDGLGVALSEVNVLRAPGVVVNYKQLQAVQEALMPEFAQSFEKKGLKLIGWGEAGEYRYFSQKPIQTTADIRTMRPWLSPDSPVMKEIWRAIGATPVPMGMGEVYGGLQTKMLDLVESTAIAYVALQWQGSDLAYMTEDTNGVLVGGWLMNKNVFDSLKPEWQAELMTLAHADTDGNRVRARQADKQAFDRLISRGYKLSKLTPEGKAQMEQIRKQVRDRLVGRVYTADLLARVQKIAAEAH
jgi:TRAP-type C4-dicarboxylate transport system substrate-binding protein